MNFAIPGLMPSDHPKYKKGKNANADGSFLLTVYSDNNEGVLPSVRCKITNVTGEVILEDLDESCVFVDQNDEYRCLQICIPAGILPVGLLTFHIALDFVDGTFVFFDHIVEVPASPFHIDSKLDE